MIPLSPAYRAHLESGATDLATCWRVVRKDGKVFGFTDHSADLQIDGTVYVAALGYTPSDISTSDDLAIDNMELRGILDAQVITEADLMAGLWDYAEVEIFEVIYSNLAAGRRVLSNGRLGEVHAGDNQFRVELMGLTQALTSTLGELYSPTCRADLGDARCKVILAGYTVSGTVTSVTDRRRFADTSLTQATGWFAQGKLKWTSGANNGLSMEVKQYNVGNIELALPMPYAIAVGDTYSVHAGCDKLFSTCKVKFSNAINFRGEPHVPGIDKMLRGK